MIDQYLWWCGVAVNLIGAVGVGAFAAHYAFFWWLRRANLWGPMLRYLREEGERRRRQKNMQPPPQTPSDP